MRCSASHRIGAKGFTRYISKKHCYSHVHRQKTLRNVSNAQGFCAIAPTIDRVQLKPRHHMKHLPESDNTSHAPPD